jgi:hypothetical protein
MARRYTYLGLFRFEVFETDIAASGTQIVGKLSCECPRRVLYRPSNHTPLKACLFHDSTNDFRFRAITDLIDDARQDFRKLLVQIVDLLPEPLQAFDVLPCDNKFHAVTCIAANTAARS